MSVDFHRALLFQMADMFVSQGIEKDLAQGSNIILSRVETTLLSILGDDKNHSYEVVNHY
jgi:hypothetical protein